MWQTQRRAAVKARPGSITNAAVSSQGKMQAVEVEEWRCKHTSLDIIWDISTAGSFFFWCFPWVFSQRGMFVVQSPGGVWCLCVKICPWRLPTCSLEWYLWAGVTTGVTSTPAPYSPFINLLLSTLPHKPTLAFLEFIVAPKSGSNFFIFLFFLCMHHISLIGPTDWTQFSGQYVQFVSLGCVCGGSQISLQLHQQTEPE